MRYYHIKLSILDFKVLTYSVWGGRLCKRFCNMFSGSSPCLLGQHGSCSSAQLPVELSENMLQNLFHNLPPQTVCIRYIENLLYWPLNDTHSQYNRKYFFLLIFNVFQMVDHHPPSQPADDAKARGHHAKRPHRRAQGQRQLEVLARHRPARRRHRHPRVRARQKVRPNILREEKEDLKAVSCLILVIFKQR